MMFPFELELLVEVDPMLEARIRHEERPEDGEEAGPVVEGLDQPLHSRVPSSRDVGVEDGGGALGSQTGDEGGGEEGAAVEGAVGEDQGEHFGREGEGRERDGFGRTCGRKPLAERKEQEEE